MTISSVPSQPVACPWCGAPVTYSGRGRRPVWCSDSCRQQAYAARRAARAGGRAVEVVVREREAKPLPAKEVVVTEYVETVESIDECIERIITSPKATYRVLRAMESRIEWGRLEDPKWDRVRSYFPATTARKRR